MTTIKGIINKLNITEIMKKLLIENYKEMNKARRYRYRSVSKTKNTYIYGMISALRYSNQITEEEYVTLFRLNETVWLGTTDARKCML